MIFILVSLISSVLAYGYGAPYKQDFEDSVNVLKYTGNLGPWSQRRGIGLSLTPPEGCEVDQVIMYHRHGERYPDYGSAKSMIKTWKKLNARKGYFNGSLAFANFWVPFTSLDDGNIALLSGKGAYSGLYTGYVTGVNYAARYGHLWNPEVITPVFASGSERIVDTARKFISGFFGYNTSSAALNIIPETDSQGANSLTPSCLNSSIPSTNCNGSRDYPIFSQLSNKWNKQYGTNFSGNDIINLLQTAAFELNIRGDSPWVEAFPEEVWFAFEHYLSSRFWCEFGPNSPSALAVGSNFVNASRTLLLKGPEAMPLSFNFAHDTDITPVMAFLGLDSAPNFNQSIIQSNSGYHLSDIMPMGGRLTIERLTCPSNPDENYTAANAWEDEYEGSFNATAAKDGNLTSTNVKNATISTNGDAYHFIRIIVNEAVVPLDNCQSGPGLSCPLQEFSDYVDERLQERTFSQVCNLTKDVPSDLQFWWKYNTTNNLNNINSTIAYQALYVDYLDRPLE